MTTEITPMDERELAARVVQYIPGPIGEMAPRTLDMLQTFHRVLGLPPITEDVLEDPMPRVQAGGAPGQVGEAPPAHELKTGVRKSPGKKAETAA